MELGEFGEVFVDVENNGDGDDQSDGKKVGANELANDVTIECLEMSGRREDSQIGHDGREPRRSLSQ